MTVKELLDTMSRADEEIIIYYKDGKFNTYLNRPLPPDIGKKEVFCWFSFIDDNFDDIESAIPSIGIHTTDFYETSLIARGDEDYED